MRHKSQMFKPIKKSKVYEEIVAKIKDMVEKGRFKSGDQLPVERELAEVFRVSRSSVREALRSLESQGFIESRQGDGTYIASQPVESLVSPLASVISTEKDDQMELFEMRRMIEPDLAYLAAERATEEEIDMMEKVLALQEEKLALGESGTDVDKNFHYIMARAAKNKAILRITDNVMDLLAESREQYLQVEGRPQKSILRHREVLEAIRARNPVRAEECMREHLVDIETSLFGASGRRKSNRGIVTSLKERR
ncbi:MAG TPA: FadR/GntR family transcriptional regulator [Desulfobacteria bacterium]|nr:FadR/GntR family transcriptional regulator [Desulfobacteria bacterium]